MHVRYHHVFRARKNNFNNPRGGESSRVNQCYRAAVLFWGTFAIHIPAYAMRCHLYEVIVEALCVTLGRQTPASVTPSVRSGRSWRAQWNAETSLTDNDESLCSDKDQCPGTLPNERAKVENSV